MANAQVRQGRPSVYRLRQGVAEDQNVVRVGFAVTVEDPVQGLVDVAPFRAPRCTRGRA